MDRIDGELWEYNLVRIVIIDVSDDYRLMQPPMPSECYPVLTEKWLPSYRLSDRLTHDCLLAGYLYDWHESNEGLFEPWYVGVVDQTLAAAPMEG